MDTLLTPSLPRTLSYAAAGLLLAACGGGGGSDAIPEGKAAMFLKDAPITTSDGRPADAVNVEILRIVLQGEGEQGDDDDQGEDDEVTVFEAAPGSGIQVNILALDVPLLLATANVPVGRYDEIEVVLNSGNATIHFTDNDTTAPLVIGGEGDHEDDDDGELEFEFDPPFTVEEAGVSNAVVDFAPIVTLDGAGHYVLGHDHENDDTGEENEIGDDEDQAEVEGRFVSADGDVLTVNVNGQSVEVDIASASEFEVDDVPTTKQGFLAALQAGDEIEAEGTFSGGTLTATKVEIEGDDD